MKLPSRYSAAFYKVLANRIYCFFVLLYTAYSIFSYDDLALIYRLLFFHFFRQKLHFALFPFDVSYYFFRLFSKYNIVFNIFLRGCAYEAECIDPQTGNLYMGETLQVTTWQHIKYKKIQHIKIKHKTQHIKIKHKIQHNTSLSSGWSYIINLIITIFLT